MAEQNIMDIYIRDLQGNYYDINCLMVEGNDCILVEIKRKDEEYRKRTGKHWIKGKDYLRRIDCSIQE